MQTNALILIDVQCGFDRPQWGRRNNPAFEANVMRRAALGNWIDADTIHRFSLASQNIEFTFLVSNAEATVAFGSSSGDSHAF